MEDKSASILNIPISTCRFSCIRIQLPGERLVLSVDAMRRVVTNVAIALVTHRTHHVVTLVHAIAHAEHVLALLLALAD